MKILAKLLFSVLIILALFTGSCKKQPKCGCDGDVINELAGFPVYLYYDTASHSAWFQPVSNPSSTYTLCNYSDHKSAMTKFESGSYLLVDGHVYWECNYLMRASNNPYYSSYYKEYMVDVTSIYEDLYGN